MQTTDISKFAGGGTVKEMQFERHVASPISEGLEHIFNMCLLVECLILASKLDNCYIKRFASSLFSPFLFFIRSFLLHSLICGNFYCIS